MRSVLINQQHTGLQRADNVFMKQLKQTQPSLFRGTKISVKQFDNLINEWSKPHPWREINAEIKRKNKQINEAERLN